MMKGFEMGKQRKIEFTVCPLLMIAFLFQVFPVAGQAPENEEGVERWIHLFESRGRQEWQKPGRVVSALGLEEGHRVADIGAGSGYFSRRFAEAVGPSGIVWAVDIEPEMLRYLQRSARQEGQHNIVTILAVADDPLLPQRLSDVIFICNTIHHFQDRVSYLRRLERYLAPGGRVVIIDYYPEELPIGPPPALKLSRQTILADAQQAGYQLTGEQVFLPYQYFLVFARTSAAPGPPETP